MDNSFHKVEDRFSFRAYGTFNCVRKGEIVYLAFLAIAYVFLLAAVILGIMLLLHLINLLNIITAAFVIIIVFPILSYIAVIIYRYILIGDVYKYAANTEKFAITDHKGKTTMIFYKDVLKVIYRPIKRVSGIRGYNVRILIDEDKEYEYDYVFTENKLLKTTDGTPFYIIEEQAGLRVSDSSFV